MSKQPQVIDVCFRSLFRYASLGIPVAAPANNLMSIASLGVTQRCQNW